MQQASSSRAPKTAGDLIRNLQLHRYLGTEETEETRCCQGLTLGGKSQSCRVSCVVCRVSCILYRVSIDFAQQQRLVEEEESDYGACISILD